MCVLNGNATVGLGVKVGGIGVHVGKRSRCWRDIACNSDPTWVKGDSYCANVYPPKITRVIYIGFKLNSSLKSARIPSIYLNFQRSCDFIDRSWSSEVMRLKF